MRTQSTKTNRRIFLAGALVLGMGVWSCMTPRSKSLNVDGTAQQKNSSPRETPIPLLPNRENNGKRCEAKYYFGIGRSGNVEGYTQFCHDLQLKLTNAAKTGNLSQIRDALQSGANVNIPVDDYDLPLQIAAANGQAEAVNLLLDNEAKINHTSFIRGTALIAAAENGHTEVVRILIEKGADVCFKADGGTAREIAQKSGYEEIVALLKPPETSKCK
jgi:hypothetical protein